MTANHPQVLEDTPAHQVDDFKAIRGIGPSTTAKLHAVGIRTYRQLGQLSPAKLSAQTGVPAKKIQQQDWAGQASKLAGSAPQVVLAEAGRSVGALPASFPEPPAPSRPAEPAAPAQPAKLEAAHPLGGILWVCAIKVWQHNVGKSYGKLRTREPLSTHLYLDLSEVEPTNNESIYFGAEVYARNMGNGRRQSIGKVQGLLGELENGCIPVACEALEPGPYRLQGVVMLALSQPLERHAELFAHIESEPYLVA